MIGVLSDIDLPPTWQWIRLGYLVSRRRDEGAADLEPLSVYLEHGVVPRSSRDDNYNRIGSDLSSYLVVSPGDLVFNKLRTWQGGLGLSRYSGIVSPAYYVCRPDSSIVEGRFLHYLLRSKPYLSELTRVSKFMPPSQFDILWDDLRTIPVGLPAPDDQQLIANFLDRETHRIDALIDAKRRMIDLLDEKWQALLTHKTGPGPRATEWEQGPLGRWWNVIDCKHRTATYVPEGVPIVGTTDVRNGRLRLDKAKSTTEDDYLDLIQGRRKPKRGDIIYSRNASLGQAAFVDTDQDFCMGQDVCLITSNDEDQLFLSYQLANSWTQQQVDQLVVGATFKRINVAEIRKLVVMRPPKDEQRRIARELDEQGQLVRSLTDSLESQLDLLADYRQALITQAVTGQLDDATLKGDRPIDEAVGVIPE